MSHSNLDPNAGREILYFIKKQVIYEVVFMSVGKNINGHKSTIVADESQVYSTVHYYMAESGPQKKTKPQSKFLNPYVDSWAVSFSANFSLFPKCQGALEERPGACAPSTR